VHALSLHDVISVVQKCADLPENVRQVILTLVESTTGKRP
jgi:hypothetical protein